MTQLTPIQQIRNRKIVIDSNIVIDYAQEGFIVRSGNPLRVLQDNDNSLGILPIVGFEILSGSNPPEVDKKYLTFLNYIPTLTMERSAYQNAATLTREYRRILRGKNNIPVPDLLIGGFIAAYSFGDDKPLLFTRDRNDFCEPIWLTVAHVPVPSADGTRIQENLYLLELNTKILRPSQPED